MKWFFFGLLGLVACQTEAVSSPAPRVPPSHPPEPVATVAEAPLSPPAFVDVTCGGRRVWFRDAEGHVVAEDGNRPLEGLEPIAHVGLGHRAALATTRSGEAWWIEDERSRVPELDGSVELALDQGIACGRNAEGVVRCRTNEPGQPPGPFEIVPLPGPATALDVAPDRACALVGSEIWCWGLLHPRGVWRPGGNAPVSPRRLASDARHGVLDTYGSLVRLDLAGALRDEHSSSAPQLGADVVQLEGGSGPLVCGRTEAGAVRCVLVVTTDDAHALLASSADTPVGRGEVHTVLEGASDLCVGSDYACAIVDGQATCWGARRDGVLGAPTSVRAEPRSVPGLGRAIALDVSDRNSCVVNDAGQVWCWGSRRATNGPWRVEGLEERRGVVLDSFGTGCAWGAHDVACWDEDARVRRVPLVAHRVVATLDGTFCALGDDAEARCWRSLDHLSGGTVAEVERSARRLARGRHLAAFGDAICVEDETVTCTRFGDVAHGPDAPTTQVAPEPELTGARTWDATRLTRCALREDTLRCAGYGSFELPIRASALSVGRHAICVVRASGGVVCFDHRGTPGTEIPDAVEVGAGSEHTCVRTTAGEVRCWGAIADNRLGTPVEPAPTRPWRVDPRTR